MHTDIYKYINEPVYMYMSICYMYTDRCILYTHVYIYTYIYMYI